LVDQKVVQSVDQKAALLDLQKSRVDAHDANFRTDELLGVIAVIFHQGSLYLSDRYRPAQEWSLLLCAPLSSRPPPKGTAGAGA